MQPLPCPASKITEDDGRLKVETRRGPCAGRPESVCRRAALSGFDGFGCCDSVMPLFEGLQERRGTHRSRKGSPVDPSSPRPQAREGKEGPRG